MLDKGFFFVFRAWPLAVESEWRYGGLLGAEAHDLGVEGVG